jgi:hypothetical protein
MLRLLGICTDEYEVKSQSVISAGHYYQLVGMVNRIQTLLSRLFCTECGTLLVPKSSSAFAHYRVTTFICAESSCGFNDDVYLHHCFNGKCGSIIDSRVSKACPNDWYICAECGCCCSDKVFSRRESNRSQVGLDAHLVNQNGHLEQEQYYCYQCGEEKHKDSKCSCGARTRTGSEWRSHENENEDIPF